MARDSVSISIEPAITQPKQRIETGQIKDCIERPCPPNSSRHVEVCVGARFEFSTPSQDSYVVQQVHLRDLQAAVGGGRLQVFKGKTPPSNDSLPQMNPTKAEPASPVVEYPALARESGLRLVLRQSHCTVLPVETVTGEPSATNAQSGGRRRTVESSLAVKSVGLPFKSGISSCPHLPGIVRDMIFERTSGSSSRIAPVVLGNELFQTSFLGTCWNARSLSPQATPLIANPATDTRRTYSIPPTQCGVASDGIYNSLRIRDGPWLRLRVWARPRQ